MVEAKRNTEPRVRSTAAPSALDLSVRAAPSVIAGLRHEACAFAAAHSADEKLVDDIALAVSEAVTNVVKYAYASPAEGHVRLTGAAAEDWLEFRVSDQGRGFREGQSDGLGLGLSLIAMVTAELTINQGQQGTEIQMRFALARPE
jgi:serine/threonine-protein kinase RsbW